jgi:hypothetical protein
VAPLELNAASFMHHCDIPSNAEVALPEALWVLSAMLRRACLLCPEAAGRSPTGAWIGWRGKVEVDSRVLPVPGSDGPGAGQGMGSGAVGEGEMRALAAVVVKIMVKLFDTVGSFRSKCVSGDLVVAPLLAVALSTELQEKPSDGVYPSKEGTT